MTEEYFDDELLNNLTQNNFNNFTIKQTISKLSYENFGNLCDKLLVSIINSNKTFKAVYGSPTSGLVIAVHLSKRLKLPLILNIHQVIKEFKSYNVLLVDNIINYNDNLLRITEILESNKINYNTAALYYRNDNFIPDFYIEKLHNNIYIEYPWD